MVVVLEIEGVAGSSGGDFGVRGGVAAVVHASRSVIRGGGNTTVDCHNV